MSNWWDDLEPWAERAEDGDYRGIATYTVDATIKANHNILAGIRNNDFDVNDPSYCELQVVQGPAGAATALLLSVATCFSCAAAHTCLSAEV